MSKATIAPIETKTHIETQIQTSEQRKADIAYRMRLLNKTNRQQMHDVQADIDRVIKLFRDRQLPVLHS